MGAVSSSRTQLLIVASGCRDCVPGHRGHANVAKRAGTRRSVFATTDWRQFSARLWTRRGHGIPESPAPMRNCNCRCATPAVTAARALWPALYCPHQGVGQPPPASFNLANATTESASGLSDASIFCPANVQGKALPRINSAHMPIASLPFLRLAHTPNIEQDFRPDDLHWRPSFPMPAQRLAIDKSRARANFSMFFRETLRTPRSMSATYVRWRSARSARASWERLISVRRLRTACPNRVRVSDPGPFTVPVIIGQCRLYVYRR